MAPRGYGLYMTLCPTVCDDSLSDSGKVPTTFVAHATLPQLLKVGGCCFASAGETATCALLSLRSAALPRPTVYLPE